MDCCNDSGGDNVNDDNINDWNNIVIIDIIDNLPLFCNGYRMIVNRSGDKILLRFLLHLHNKLISR